MTGFPLDPCVCFKHGAQQFHREWPRVIDEYCICSAVHGLLMSSRPLSQSGRRSFMKEGRCGRRMQSPVLD